MYLTVNGQRQDLIDIRQFREEWQVPHSFSVSFFEPKDYAGLGHIENAGAAMNQVRDAVLDTVPVKLTLEQLPALLDQLGQIYHRKLLQINDQVRLREVEIDFAVAGFRDMIQTLFYTLIRSQTTNTEPPSFNQIYRQWLDDSTRVSQRIHTYQHQGGEWQIQIINTVYGRAGLLVDTGAAVICVADSQLACPAEGFMFQLLKNLTEKIVQSLRMGETKSTG